MKSTLIAIGVLLFVISCKEDKGLERKLPPIIEETSVVKKITTPSEANSQLPKLFSSGVNLYFSWSVRNDCTDYLKFSVLKDGNWTESVDVANGNDWFTNWADYPAIAQNDGTILTNILQKSADGTYTYDVRLNLIEEASGNRLGEESFILHDDGTESEHGFVSMIPYQEDSFYVTWLDGRNTAGGHYSHDTHGNLGAMTLRAAEISKKGKITNDTELDARVCDCCNTAMAMTSHGPIIAYRDRSNDEIRDISVVRLVNAKWTSPQTVGKDHWKIAGCPVNGPAIDSFGSTVALVWYTANKDEGDVKVAFSMDDGETFGTPFRIDAGDATGRVDIVAIDEKEAAVLWMQPNGDEEELLLMKINHHGYTEPPVVIATMSDSRSSGFPQLERVGDRLYVAWTQLTEKSTSIKMANILISDL